MAAAARRFTLNVPNAFISIVVMKAPLSCGVPSRETVRPPPTPPPATFTTIESVPSRAGRLDGVADGVVIVDVATHRDHPVAQLVGQRRAPVEVAVEDDDPDTTVDESADGRCAQATRSTGDER